MGRVLSEKRCRLATIALSCVLAASSFVILVPLAVTLNQAGNMCLLYGSTSGYGSKVACAYPIGVAAVLQLGYCTARASFHFAVLLGFFSSRLLNKEVFLVACFVIDVISSLLTLISGGIISHGFNRLCSNIFQPYTDRCGELNIYDVETSRFIDNYYLPLRLSVGGVWISWIFWLLLLPMDGYILNAADVLDLQTLLSFLGLGGRPTPADSARESRAATRQLFLHRDVTRVSSDASTRSIIHTHREWSPVPSRDNSPSRRPPPLPQSASAGRIGGVGEDPNSGGSGPSTPPFAQKMFTIGDSPGGRAACRTPPPMRAVPPRPIV